MHLSVGICWYSIVFSQLKQRIDVILTSKCQWSNIECLARSGFLSTLRWVVHEIFLTKWGYSLWTRSGVYYTWTTSWFSECRTMKWFWNSCTDFGSYVYEPPQRFVFWHFGAKFSEPVAGSKILVHIWTSPTVRILACRLAPILVPIGTNISYSVYRNNTYIESLIYSVATYFYGSLNIGSIFCWELQ